MSEKKQINQEDLQKINGGEYQANEVNTSRGVNGSAGTNLIKTTANITGNSEPSNDGFYGPAE